MSDPTDVLARTIYGEARGEILEGKQAVASAIMNRVAKKSWYGQDVEGVCLFPYQFSCWDPYDPNRKKLLAVDESDPVFVECLQIADEAISGVLRDKSNGATHYHTKHVRPAWAAGKAPCYAVGAHLFYNDVK